MLQFIKSNSLISILLFCLVGGFLAFVQTQQGFTYFPWEIKNYLIGQKLNQGFRLYKDIRDNTGPFATGFYQLLDFFSIPISSNPYIAFSIICLQAYLFQRCILQFDLMPKLGGLAFGIYLFLFHLTREFYVPDPALLGLTFLLLTWKEIIQQQKTLLVNDRVFLVGVYLATATLLVPAYFWVLPWAILSLLFYSGISIRQIILVLIGYLFVITITSLVFSFRGNLPYLWQVYRQSVFTFQLISWEESKLVLLTFAPAFLLGIWGLYKVVGNPKIRAHAQKAQQTTIIWFFFSFLSMANFPSFHRINFVILLPPLAYFGLNIFYVIKKNWQKELVFVLLVASVFILAKQDYKEGEMTIKQKPLLSISGQKLLVLGPEIDEYLHNEMAGPFVNWELAKPLLSQLNSYKNVITVQEYFAKDQPTYIYDSEGYLSKIGQYLPSITQQYVLVSPKLYRKK
ncbi:MAG: hypothetical protein RIR57_1305 [Bacteroidota bacterium]